MLIEAKNLSMQFRQPNDQNISVLDNVSLNVNGGEMLAIVGPSGSGKTTLLYCLAGLLSPTSGTVSILGEDITQFSQARLSSMRRNSIGFVFQAYNLLPYLSALENVALPLKLRRRKKIASSVSRNALAAVGLSGKERSLPSQLSGGQQQRVAIARVLAGSPEVVFADEPTGALDSRNGIEVLNLLRNHAQVGAAVVLVTHDLDLAAMADRVIVLRDGHTIGEIKSPTPKQLFCVVNHEPEERETEV